MSPRRTAATVAVALLALLATPAAYAEPVTAKSLAEAAAGWLARQLVDGERFEDDLGGTVYPDQGLTVDTLLALDAAGVAQDNAAKALAWLGRPEIVAGYVTDEEGTRYAGGYAKLALAVLAQGGDPTAFGGVDLIAGLTALQAPSGRFVNRVDDPADPTNNFTQSLAVITLERHGTAPKAAVDYLAGSACPDGGFPLKFEQPTCAAQVDATAMVVQALLAAGRTADAGAGLDWLAGQQLADGGFPDNGLPDGQGTKSNANSTGLAAQALRAGGRTADRAVAYLTGLQVGCGNPAAGAIAYDAKGFTPGNATRATAQAVLGLAGTSLADITADGDRPAAPVLDCTTTTTQAPTTTTDAPATPDATADDEPVASGAGELARTGPPVGPTLWTGALLVVAGALTVLLSRKRYATVKEKR